jgi:hypothetical protein
MGDITKNAEQYYNETYGGGEQWQTINNRRQWTFYVAS